MPPLEGSRTIHHEVDLFHHRANEVSRLMEEQETQHSSVSQTALGILGRSGREYVGSRVLSPWVENPKLAEGNKKTDYRLKGTRVSAAVRIEDGGVGEIQLAVRVSRPNPLEPDRLIAMEEQKVILNALATYIDEKFEEGERRIIHKGIGVVSSDAPDEALDVTSELFLDTVDTVNFMDTALPPEETPVN